MGQEINSFGFLYFLVEQRFLKICHLYSIVRITFHSKDQFKVNREDMGPHTKILFSVFCPIQFNSSFVTDTIITGP